MKEHKNLIWLLILLVIIFGLFLGLYFYKNNSTVKVNKNNFTPTSDEVRGQDIRPQVDVDTLVDGIKTEYKNSASFKECIAMDMGIQSCFRDAVRAKVNTESNPSFCDDLSSKSEATQCKERFYIEKGKKENDINICNKLENSETCKYEILRTQAEKQADEKICESLTDENNKRNCIEVAVRSKAVKTNNLSLCDKLIVKRKEGEGENAQEYVDKMQAEMCKEEVKMRIEMAKEDERMRKEMEADAKRMEAEVNAENNKPVEEKAI